MSGDESLASDGDYSVSGDKYLMTSLHQSMQHQHITKLGEIILELGRDVIGDQCYDEILNHIREIMVQASKLKDESDDLFICAFSMEVDHMKELRNEAEVEAKEQYSDLGWASEIVTQCPSSSGSSSRSYQDNTPLSDRGSESVDMQ